MTTNANPRRPGLVSVIIPNYNHAPYIADAIQSVLRQVYRHFEVVVVDDGSTDNSREVVAQFGDSVKYVWQENQGLSAARNTGIAAAAGEFVGLLDADDMYEPDFLSTLVPMMLENPDIDGVHCGYQFVDHQNHPLAQIEARTIPEGELYTALLDSNFLVPESMLIRKYCYEGVGPFDVSLRACEDWDMWLRMSARFNFRGTPQVLTRHRVLPGSMSADPKRMMDNRYAVLNKHFGAEPAPDVRDSAKRAYGRAHLASCVEYLQVGDIDKADGRFRKMAVACPKLLAELDTFYQLGIGSQPKGRLGDFNTLDLSHNAAVLVRLLEGLFADEQLAHVIEAFRRVAYGKAYYSLALLCHGARRFPEARRHFLTAFRSDPRLGLNRQFVATWSKTLLGKRLFNLLQQSKEKLC